MPEVIDVEVVTDAVIDAFSEPGIPSESEVEAVLRPFGVLLRNTQVKVELLLSERGHGRVWSLIFPWVLVNFVVAGNGPKHEADTNFLLKNYHTCTCYPDYLVTAIRLATDEVDPRIIALAEKNPSHE